MTTVASLATTYRAGLHCSKLVSRDSWPMMADPNAVRVLVTACTPPQPSRPVRLAPRRRPLVQVRQPDQLRLSSDLCDPQLTWHVCSPVGLAPRQHSNSMFAQQSRRGSPSTCNFAHTAMPRESIPGADIGQRSAMRLPCARWRLEAGNWKLSCLAVAVRQGLTAYRPQATPRSWRRGRDGSSTHSRLTIRRSVRPCHWCFAVRASRDIRRQTTGSRQKDWQSRGCRCVSGQDSGTPSTPRNSELLASSPLNHHAPEAGCASDCSCETPPGCVFDQAACFPHNQQPTP